MASMKRTRVNSIHNVNPSTGAAEALHDADAPLRKGWMNADTLGIAASALCVVHCLALPLVAIALPALASSIGDDHITHYILALFVVAFCLFAIIPGYRQHRHYAVLFGMASGLSLVLFATFAADHVLGPYWEIPIITLGNFLVVASHLRNRKLLAATRVCC